MQNMQTTATHAIIWLYLPVIRQLEWNDPLALEQSCILHPISLKSLRFFFKFGSKCYFSLLYFLDGERSHFEFITLCFPTSNLKY